MNQEQAERRELEAAACRHLSLDELREGVVSRAEATRNARVVSGLLEIVNEYLRAVMQFSLDEGAEP